jgi:hypothetical protein
MIGIGKKGKEWIRARKQLVKIYKAKGITRCEYCNSNWALGFHHLEKRSSGKAQHTFEATRLLCQMCHDLAEYNDEFNEKVRALR